MNHELIERIDSLFSAYTEGEKRSSSMSVIKILTDCRAALSQAEPVSVPPGVEEWIEVHTHDGGGYEVVQDHVYVEDLRAYLSGMAIVPVEFVESVANVGNDFGYGRYEVEKRFVKMARAISTAIKERTE